MPTMILSFADRDAEALFHGRFAKKLAPDMQRSAQRKLLQIHQAGRLQDLAVPPGNRLPASTASGSTISGVSASFGRVQARKGSRLSTIIKDDDHA